jgi:CheY-like chemotaxis protein
MRIALVNDVMSAVEAVRRVILGTREHQVARVARDSAEAPGLHASDAPDVFLMDLIMPGMDRVEAVRRIMSNKPCASSFTRGIPRIVPTIRPLDFSLKARANSGRGTWSASCSAACALMEPRDCALCTRGTIIRSPRIGPAARSMACPAPRRNFAPQLTFYRSTNSVPDSRIS